MTILPKYFYLMPPFKLGRQNSSIILNYTCWMIICWCLIDSLFSCIKCYNEVWYTSVDPPLYFDAWAICSNVLWVVNICTYKVTLKWRIVEYIERYHYPNLLAWMCNARWIMILFNSSVEVLLFFDTKLIVFIIFLVKITILCKIFL